MKNVLIIGGSYFTGRVFVEALVHLNTYRPHVFNRGHIPIKSNDVTAYRGDREKPLDIFSNLPALHWHVVVDFCAYTPEHITDMLDNIQGAIGHYILISTTSVYASNSATPIKENAVKVETIQPELGDFADYGYNKWRAEGVLKEKCRQRQIPCTIVRPAIIYGRYNYAPRESFYFKRINEGVPIIVPRQAEARFSFVWVEDIARMLLLSLENPKVFGRTFNLAGPETISYPDLVSALEAACGQQILVKEMPVHQMIREEVHLPFPPDTHLLYDGSAICQVLGFQYTPFVKGMTRTWPLYNLKRPTV